MAGRRRKSRRSREVFDIEVLRDYAIAFAILLSIIAVFYVAWVNIAPILRLRSAQEDVFRACLEGERINSHTIILLDVTDTYSDTQKDAAVAFLKSIQAGMTLGDKLTMYALTDQPFSPKQIGSACRPKTASESNSLVEPEIEVETKWRQFQRDMRVALNAALSSDEAKASPIIESFQTLRDRPDFSPAIGSRRIVIISDMLQHGATVSLYRDSNPVLSAKDFESLQKSTDLKNVEILILQVRRINVSRQQSETFSGFWTSYFREVGAWPAGCHESSQGCPFK